MFPKDVNYIPDCIFYFCEQDSEDKRMCFKRVKAKHILIQKGDEEKDRNKKTMLIKLEEDRCLGLLEKGETGGLVYVKV